MHWVVALVLPVARLQVPSGGILSAPQPERSASAAVMHAETAAGFAPMQRLSLAPMSWCASEIAPLPATGWLRIWSSSACVYELPPSVIGRQLDGHASGWFFQ